MSELLRAAASATHPASGSLLVAPAGPALAPAGPALAPAGPAPAQPGDSDYDSDELPSSPRDPASSRTALLRGTERVAASFSPSHTSSSEATDVTCCPTPRSASTLLRGSAAASGGASAELKRRSTKMFQSAKMFHRRSSSGGGGVGAAELQPRTEPCGAEGALGGGAVAGAESPGADGQRTWRMTLKDLERIAMGPGLTSSLASPRHGARQREPRDPVFACISSSPSSSPPRRPPLHVVRGISAAAAVSAESVQVSAKLMRAQPGESFGLGIVDTATGPAVSSLEMGGLAEAADLRVGDCVDTVDAPQLGINAIKIKDREHMSYLLGYLGAGVECTITVSRIKELQRRERPAATQGDWST